MKRLLDKVTSALRSELRPEPTHHEKAGYRVFVHIDEPLTAERRLRKYQKPLHQALMLAHLGHVTSGGSVQGTDGTIHWISLELRLRDLDGALHFACGKLRELGASARSTVKYHHAGSAVVRAIH